jgi:ABC-type Fe3+/spermidine/putrescine transport system ATPase subunit
MQGDGSTFNFTGEVNPTRFAPLPKGGGSGRQDRSHGVPAGRKGDVQASEAPRRSYGIAVEAVEKSYGAVQVLRGVSLDIPPGSFVALLGPSGCGKTTLLRTIAGLEQPNSGAIRIGDETVVDTRRGIQVPTQKRRLGMMFQSYALWPHMTVAQNITYPLRKQRVPKEEWASRVEAAMAAVDLPAILDRRPSQLSGGQQQRVALARAMVARPRVMLLDEPLSNLDANLRDQLRRELRLLHDRQGTTTILVTHDQQEAAMLADLIAVVNNGRIVQAGPPADILDRPVDRFTAEFVGYDNYIDAEVLSVSGDSVTLRLDGGQSAGLRSGRAWQPGQRVSIAMRSHEIRVATGPGDGGVQIEGMLSATFGLGHWREHHVGIGDARLVVRERADSNPDLRPGSAVKVAIPEASPVLAR